MRSINQSTLRSISEIMNTPEKSLLFAIIENAINDYLLPRRSADQSIERSSAVAALKYAPPLSLAKSLATSARSTSRSSSFFCFSSCMKLSPTELQTVRRAFLREYRSACAKQPLSQSVGLGQPAGRLKTPTKGLQGLPLPEPRSTHAALLLLRYSQPHQALCLDKQAAPQLPLGHQSERFSKYQGRHLGRAKCSGRNIVSHLHGILADGYWKDGVCTKFTEVDLTNSLTGSLRIWCLAWRPIPRQRKRAVRSSLHRTRSSIFGETPSISLIGREKGWKSAIYDARSLRKKVRAKVRKSWGSLFREERQSFASGSPSR